MRPQRRLPGFLRNMVLNGGATARGIPPWHDSLWESSLSYSHFDRHFHAVLISPCRCHISITGLKFHNTSAKGKRLCHLHIIKGKLKYRMGCRYNLIQKPTTNTATPRWPERSHSPCLSHPKIGIKQVWCTAFLMCPFLFISTFWRETAVTISDVQCSHLRWSNNPARQTLTESLQPKWDSQLGLSSPRHKLTKTWTLSSTAWHRCEWTSVGAVWHVRKKNDSGGKREEMRMLFQQ